MQAIRSFALAVVCFVLLAPLATAQPLSDPGRSGEHRMDSWERMDPAKREMGMDRAEDHRMFARLLHDKVTGDVLGRFIHFHLVTGTGQMHDLASSDGVANHTFFRAITPSRAVLQDPRITGSVMHLVGDNYTLMAHNNPTAAMHWRATANMTLKFELAAGASIANATAREVRIATAAIHGHVLTNGNSSISVAGTTLMLRLAPGESAMFRAHPSGLNTTLLHAQNRAFTQRVLGSVVHVADGGGQPVEDAADDGATAQAIAIGRGHVRFNVSSTQHEGRVLFLAIDGQTIDPARAATIQVTLDGKAMPRAASIDAVVANSQGSVAFTTDAAAGITYLAVRIPQFSSYVLAILDPGMGGSDGTSQTSATGATSGPTSQGAPGAGFAVLALAVVGLAVALRRRQA